MKRLIKRAWIPCIAYWLIWGIQYAFMATATESWMILWLLVLVPFRSMLWLSPWAISAIIWICGLIKPRCPISKIVMVNAVALLINIWPFFATYLLFGSWY